MPPTEPMDTTDIHQHPGTPQNSAETYPTEGSTETDNHYLATTYDSELPETHDKLCNRERSLLGSTGDDYQESKAVRTIETECNGCASSISTSEATADNASGVRNTNAPLVVVARGNRETEDTVPETSSSKTAAMNTNVTPSLMGRSDRQVPSNRTRERASRILFRTVCVKRNYKTLRWLIKMILRDAKTSVHADSLGDTSSSDSVSFEDSLMAQDGSYEEKPDHFFMKQQYNAEASPGDSQLDAGNGLTQRSYEVHFERVSDDSSSSDVSGDDADTSPLPPQGTARPYPTRLSPIDGSEEEPTSDTRPARSPSPEGVGRGQHSDGGVAPSVPIGDLSLSIPTPTWPDTRRRPPAAAEPADFRALTEDQLPCDGDMDTQSKSVPDDTVNAVDLPCPPEKLRSIGNGLATGEKDGKGDAQPDSETHEQTQTESFETAGHLSSTAISLQSANFPESGQVLQLSKNTKTANSETEVSDTFMSSGPNQDNVPLRSPQNTENYFNTEEYDSPDVTAVNDSSHKDRLAAGEISVEDSVTSLVFSQSPSDLSAAVGSEVPTVDTSLPDGDQRDVPNPLPPLPPDSAETQGEGHTPAPAAITATTATPPRKYSDLYSDFETPCEPRYRLHAGHDRSKVYLGPALSRTRPAVIRSEIPPCVLSEIPPPSSVTTAATAAAPAAGIPVVRCDDRCVTEEGQVIGSGAADRGCQTAPREAGTMSPSPPPTPPPSPQPGERATASGDELTKTVNGVDLMTPAEALMTALSSDRVIAERDASAERAGGSFERVDDEIGDGVMTGEMTAAGDKNRKHGVSDNEAGGSLSDSSGTEEEFRKMLPRSKPPEKIQTSEEIIEIQECPPQDSVYDFSADGYSCDQMSEDTEPDQKFTPSDTGMPQKLPRNESAVTDSSLWKSSENAPRSQLDNVDAIVAPNTDAIGTAISENVMGPEGFDSNRNTTYKVHGITDKMNDRDDPTETTGEGQMSNQIIPENYRGEEAADIHTMTAPVKISPEDETDVIEKGDAGVEHAYGSSSDSSTSADTVRAVCSTPQPRTLSTCSQFSGTGSIDAVDSLPDDSVELQPHDGGLSAVTCKGALTYSCSPSDIDSADPCSLSQVDTPDTPSTPDTAFSYGSSNRAETSYMDSVKEDSSTAEEFRAPARESFPSQTELEERKEQRALPGAEADKDRKLVSRRTVYWAPGTPPPPQQDCSEPVLLHFVTIDPDLVTPAAKVEQESLELEAQTRPKPLDEADRTTGPAITEKTDESQLEEQAKEPDRTEQGDVSELGRVSEIDLNLQEPEVTSGPDEPEDTSDRREPASAVVGNWLLSGPASLDGYVARIVRRHSECGGDTTPPPSSGRRLSPTNFCLEETKKMLEKGNRSEVKPQGEEWIAESPIKYCLF